MAEEQLSQEQLLEQQRQNCIFCKIVKGEMTSRKVYEDDGFLAVMDINPAAPGQVILMPKDHVPILAVLPEDRMRSFFSLASKLAAAVQEAMFAQRVTILCPSGFAAGQRPPYHLLLYIVPREKGDNLDKLDLQNLETPQADAVVLSSALADAMRQVLVHVGRDDLLKTHHIHKKHPADAVSQSSASTQDSASPAIQHPIFAQSAIAPRATTSSAAPLASAAAVSSSGADGALDTPVTSGAPDAPESAEFSSASAALEHVLAMSPELRRFIIMQPELVDDYVKRSPKLSKLFEGVDIQALSHMLRAQDAHEALHASTGIRAAADDAVIDGPAADSASAGAGDVPTNHALADGAASTGAADVIAARDMPDADLFAFIDGNAALRQWLIEHPKELAENVGKNPRLALFFAGSDVLAIARRYRDHVLKGGAA
ncbi:TPA: HIT family protein [Candidatus Woesearchaeota archaeon]|nr:HIT family protein [Candidatus Woesearchaeota archaeon]